MLTKDVNKQGKTVLDLMKEYCIENKTFKYYFIDIVEEKTGYKLQWDDDDELVE